MSGFAEAEATVKRTAFELAIGRRDENGSWEETQNHCAENPFLRLNTQGRRASITTCDRAQLSASPADRPSGRRGS
jgi:hypothetical protein